MKKAITMLAMFGILFTVSTAVNAIKPIDIRIGGKVLETDVKPIIIEGRTMLPVRAVFEALGAEVDYIAEERKAVATKKDTVVTFVIDSNVMTINGAEKTIDVPAMIKDSSTLVPVRACAESFDLKVEWNNNTRTVIIKAPVSVIEQRYSVSDNTLVSYEYDANGNKLLEDKPGISWKKYAYDENDNLIRAEYSNGFAATFTYDSMGNPLTYEDTSGSKMKYVHDENGNLTYFEGSDGSWQKAAYDENGNMTYYEDSKGNKVTMTYDANGNLITRSFANGTWERYGYDANGNLTYSQNSDFKWKKVDYSVLNKKVRSEDSDGNWERCTYDKDGNLLRLENSAGFWKEQTFDSEGRQTSYKDSDGVTRDISYNENGKIVYYQDARDGSWKKHSYDGDNHLLYAEYSTGSWEKYKVIIK